MSSNHVSEMCLVAREVKWTSHTLASSSLVPSTCTSWIHGTIEWISYFSCGLLSLKSTFEPSWSAAPTLLSETNDRFHQVACAVAELIASNSSGRIDLCHFGADQAHCRTGHGMLAWEHEGALTFVRVINGEVSANSEVGSLTSASLLPDLVLLVGG